MRFAHEYFSRSRGGAVGAPGRMLSCADMPRTTDSLKFALFLVTLPAFGCSKEDYTILTCQWKEDAETKTATFCYANRDLCKSSFPDDQAFCAWNVFSSMDPADISKFSNPDGFAGHADENNVQGEWQEGSCMDSHQSSKDFPPYPGHPDSDCYSESGGGSGGGSGQSSASATAPTTSAGTDSTTGSTTGSTTDDSSTTESTGGGLEKYICSTQSPWKCANLQPDNALTEYPSYPDPWADPNESTHALWDACWSKVNTGGSPHLSKCAMAVSPEEATTICQDDCKEYRTMLEEACAGDPDCDVSTTIDCDLDGTYVNSSGMPISGDVGGEKPVLKSNVPSWECDGEALVGGGGSYHQFEGSATLVTPQGDSAGVGSFRGYLGYTLSGCTATECTITVDALVGLTKAVEGGYSDAAGAGGLFEVQGMGFQTTAPFSGTWSRVRDTVTFPDATMSTQFWADAVLVDGTPVTSGYGAYTIETDQIVGSLRTDDGPLSLNLTIDLMPFYGVVSVSLHTLDPS